MRVLVACEFSGVVRDEFETRGHHAVSCDLRPSESFDGYHHQGDVRDLLKDSGWGSWDLMIAHPSCRYTCVAGARWKYEKPGWAEKQEESLAFIRLLLNAPIDQIALEHPVSIVSTRIRKPDQYIQPWQFGHGETKKTGLWLKNLPLLVPTKIVKGREPRVWKMGPHKDRAKDRSRTYLGIAKAMAEQWG